MRRRRQATLQLRPYDEGHIDPLDALALPPGPSDFGLRRAELEHEIDRCRAGGWLDWELHERFLNPRSVAA